MDALRLIQAGQKDFDRRLARVENVPTETRESLDYKSRRKERPMHSLSRYYLAVGGLPLTEP